MSLPQLSDAPSLDAQRADEAARALHRTAVAWAGAFLRSRAGLDPTLLAQLATETLAFSLAILDARLRSRGSAAVAWGARVRQAAWTRHNRWRRPGHSPRLLGRGAPTADGASDPAAGSALARHLAGGGDGEDFSFTDAMVAEFCELTGLGTREVVGNGENRAAMGFYLVVHGRVFARRPESREERRWLIQALRDCRRHLEGAVDHWLNPPAGRPASARIGR